jgi:hypothetical protein
MTPQQRYRQRHPDRVRASQQKYRDANYLYLAAMQACYYDRNKYDAEFMDRRRASNRRSYARCKQRYEELLAAEMQELRRQIEDDLQRGTPHAGRFDCKWTGSEWCLPCTHSRRYNPCRKCVAAAERFTARSGVNRGCLAIVRRPPRRA